MAVFTGGLLTFLLFADIVVYSLYRFHINIPMLSLFCSPAAFELVEVPLAMALMVAGVAAVIFTGEFFLLKIAFKCRLYKSCFAVFMVILLSYGTFNAMHAWAAFSGKQEIMIRTEALPLKYAMTASRFFMRHGYKPAPKLTARVGSCINYPLAELQFDPAVKPKNIIIVLVDSLRADMLTPEIMPNICKMSENIPSAKFMHHFSGGNCTKTGVFSLFYGIPGCYFDQALRSGVGAAMIDSMLKKGYDVKVFAGSTLASPPFNRTVFVNVPELEVHQAGSSKLERDKNSIGKCINYLEKRDPAKPYFILLFLDSVHGNAVPENFPFKFATPMKQMNFLTLNNDEKTKKDALNLMRNASFYMDSVLNDFFQKVDMPRRIKEDTVLLITSDHGNEAAETEMQNWGHNSNFARFQTQTPLVVFGLDRPAQTIDYRTSAMDISATLMQDVLGCRNPVRDYSCGRNLFDQAEREFIISSSYLENAVIYGNNIFVQTVYGVMQKYDIDGRFINDPLPPAVVKKFFEVMTDYSK